VFLENLVITERSCYAFRGSLTCLGEFVTGLNSINAVRTLVWCSLIRFAFFFNLLPANCAFIIGKGNSALGRLYWNSMFSVWS